MLNLPGDVTTKYSLREHTTQEQFVNDLENRIDCAVSFFKSIPQEKGWLREETNQVLACNCISKFETLALEGKLAVKDARKVYLAVVEAGLGSLFNTITCRFNKGDILTFNKMLFNSSSENSRQHNFNNKLSWANGEMGFVESDYQSILYISEWLKTGKVQFDSVEPKNVTKVIGELLLATAHQELDEMTSQILDFVDKSLTLLEKVDVALYVGSDDVLSHATFLLRDFCMGLGITAGPGKVVKLVVNDTEPLIALWKTEGKGLLKHLFQIFVKHEVDVSFRLEAVLGEQDGGILEELCSIFGGCVKRFSLLFKETEESSLQMAISGLVALLCDMQNLEYFHIEATGSNLLEEHFLQIAAICPAVSSLAFDDCQQAGKEFVTGMVKRSSMKLEHLRVNGCGDIDDTVAEAVAEYCPNISVFYFDSGDMDSNADISQEAIVAMFGKCEKLKTLQFYNSENAPAPPEDLNPYDLGVINVLMENFPDRVIHLNYNLSVYT